MNHGVCCLGPIVLLVYLAGLISTTEAELPISLHQGNRVGIIGGGISGLASAHFLREQLGPEADIILYERMHVLGGRLRTVNMSGTLVELGARYFHPTNQMISQITTEAQLESYQPANTNTDPHGVWDGSEMLFREAQKDFWGNLVTAYRLLERYRLEPFWMKHIGSKIPRDMLDVYDTLRQGRYSSTPHELFSSLSYVERNDTFHEYLRARDYGSAYAWDIVDALLRARNPLGLRQNSFSAMVDLQLTSQESYRLSRGFGEMIEYLRSASNVQVHFNTVVTSINKTNHGPIEIQTMDGRVEKFDTLILATPLTKDSNITLHGLENSLGTLDYVPVYVTVVRGQLNFSYFDLASEGDDILPQKILTSSRLLQEGRNVSLPLTSLLSISTTSDPHIRVYRLTSTEKLSQAVLDRLFVRRQETYQTVHHNGYPQTHSSRMPFRLAENIYYPCSTELLLSTVETQIITASNIALEVARKIK